MRRWQAAAGAFGTYLLPAASDGASRWRTLHEVPGERLTDVTTTAASALLGLTPTLIALLIFQRTLIPGITAGAVK